MADGINIRILPKTEIAEPKDLLLIDKPILGTHTISFSSVILSGYQVSFYSDFLALSSNVRELSATTTTFISGGVSPSGMIVPSKVGIMYFAASTKDYFVSVGTLTDKDWKRILTVNY
jgi:hypothetical protein